MIKLCTKLFDTLDSGSKFLVHVVSPVCCAVVGSLWLTVHGLPVCRVAIWCPGFRFPSPVSAGREGRGGCISGSPLRMGELPFIWAVCSPLSEQIALWSQVCFQDLGIPKDVMILSLHKGVDVEDEEDAVYMFIWLGYITDLYIIYVYTHAVHHAAHSVHSVKYVPW